MSDALIGVVNAGSSSLKFSVYAGDERLLVSRSGVSDGATLTLALGGADAEGVNHLLEVREKRRRLLPRDRR